MGIAYPRTGQRVAVIGLADEKAIYHAGGSGSVEPSFVSTPLQGITDAAKALGSQVTFDDGSCALRAAALAKTSDVVLVFVGTLSAEGDRHGVTVRFGWAWLDPPVVKRMS